MPEKKVCTKVQEMQVECKDTPGAGAEIFETLGAAKVNMIGTVGYTMEPGKAWVHVLVEQGAAAKRALKKAGYGFKAYDVALASMSNKPGALAGILRKVADAGVNLGFAYALGMGTKGAAVLFIKDAKGLAKAIRAINAGK